MFPWIAGIARIKDEFRPHCCLHRLTTFTSLIRSHCCYGFFFVPAKHQYIFLQEKPVNVEVKISEENEGFVLIYKISIIVADTSNILKLIAGSPKSLLLSILKQLHGPQAPYHFELFQACAQFKHTDKGARLAEGDQKFSLNMVKKDQLSAIALMKRR